MTPVPSLSLDRFHVETLLAHAARAGDVEICGFITQDEHAAQQIHEIENIAERRADRFEMDVAAQIVFFRWLRQSRAELIAIYHSHPRGEARPSAHDIAGHSHPQVPALIVAPQAVHGDSLRAWSMAATPAPVEMAITQLPAFL